MRWLLGARLFLTRIFLPRTLRGAGDLTPELTDPVTLCMQEIEVGKPGFECSQVGQIGFVASDVGRPGFEVSQAGCC